MRIIAIANQKGGVGKTTTAVNLAAGLQVLGKRVLCLDFDPQCHLAKYLGYSPDGSATITHCIFAKATYQPMPATDGLIRRSSAGGDFIPSDIGLSKADLVLAQAMFRERILAEVLRMVVPAGTYDYLIVDCNPSMGILLTNALVAATDVLIPIQAEDFSVDGLDDMLELITLIRQQINPRLELLGLLPTMVGNNNTCRGIVQSLEEHFPDLTMPPISRSIAAAKSCGQAKPLIGGKTKLAEQYQEAAAVVLRRTAGEE